jgi:hypothetical protein
MKKVVELPGKDTPTPEHFIAVSNNHGWGKAETLEKALKFAVEHSSHQKATIMAVWGCSPDAYVDGMGTAYGVLTERRRFERTGALRGTWKEVPDHG